ncbi:MAG: exonuclease SbcCD subunit D [Clostridia bacterium]|nr:exonuclease SbcCD subunit D [Clostridia bacterium]
MKFIHLSDLHLGKRVNEFSMLDDQRHILGEILRLIDEERPDALLIAGDIYDKAVPSAEAVGLFDDFLCKLAERRLQVFAISGNHDSPERIAFASRLIDGSGVHLSPVWNGHMEPVTLQDAYGGVKVWMLPFIKPVHVRQALPDAEIASYNDALAAALEQAKLNPDERNILVTHQFVTGASRCDSEEISVGGSDAVDVSLFDAFDYTALGHIHGAQSVGRDVVRYCGTPLKYSFSEASHEKSLTVVELLEKGNITIRTIPLKPLHDMRELRGSYMELTARENYAGTAVDDYLHITLTDEEDVPNAMGKLRVIYPNLMKLDYDNLRTRSSGVRTDTPERPADLLTLFGDFYRQMNGQPLSDEQHDYVRTLIEKIWEDEQ